MEAVLDEPFILLTDENRFGARFGASAGASSSFWSSSGDYRRGYREGSFGNAGGQPAAGVLSSCEAPGFGDRRKLCWKTLLSSWWSIDH